MLIHISSLINRWILVQNLFLSFNLAKVICPICINHINIPQTWIPLLLLFFIKS